MLLGGGIPITSTVGAILPVDTSFVPVCRMVVDFAALAVSPPTDIAGQGTPLKYDRSEIFD